MKMVEELAVTGARTARESYGARGWVTHPKLRYRERLIPVRLDARGRGIFWERPVRHSMNEPT